MAQIKAPKEGKTYADLSREKALKEAMGETAFGDKTKVSEPASGDKSKPK